MKLSVKMFNHSSRHKSFSAEVSDLGSYFFAQPLLTLVSDGGTEATFCFRRAVLCGTIDNEIQCWEYQPTREALATNPRLKDYTLTVFND